MLRTYKELMSFSTFEERFEYLKLGGSVGRETFGFARYLNQLFYNSKEWKFCRRDIIVRDNACDLAIPDRKIGGRVIVHHLNSISLKDIEQGNDCMFDPNNLICTSHLTSLAIHYGDETMLPVMPKERSKGDTTPWKVY